jgi:hypothetical protein
MLYATLVDPAWARAIRERVTDRFVQKKSLAGQQPTKVIVKSRGSSNHGTNKIVPCRSVDLRTRKELRKMQFVRI